MEIVMKRVSELTPYDKNAKKHDAGQITNVAQSISEMGWKQPIVIDGNGVVIVGHCRLLAAKKLKQKEVPCVVADDLTPEQIKKYRILDNKLAESPWDLDLLAEDADGLDFSGYDLDLGEFNISPDEFEDNFDLPDGEKPDICQMTFTLHSEQKALIEYAIGICKDCIQETFGNTNANGNALYEVVRQWAEQRK